MAACTFAAALAGWETFLRSRGFRPSISDSPALWAFERWRGATAKMPALYLLGKSRIRNAIDPDVLEREIPGAAAVQLAVEGTSPVAMLVDLTTSSDRPRWVVCSIQADDLVAPPDRQQTEYVEACHRPGNLNDMANEVLGALASDRLASLRSTANVRLLASRYLRRQRNLAVPHTQQYFVRWGRLFFHDPRVDVAAIRSRLWRRWQSHLERWPPPPEQEWDRQLQRLVDTVQALERRGIRVAFVRMPTTGRWWQLDEARYPKHRYWDRLAKAVGTIAIHFRDYPELRDFECPDDSHIDVRDQPRFTRALIDILRRKGFFDETTRTAHAALR